MTRAYHDTQGNLTRAALRDGLSISYTSDEGNTITLARDTSTRSRIYVVTITDKLGTRTEEFNTLGMARYAFEDGKARL